MMNDDPWESVPTPSAPEAIHARRVDETGPWDFFWARDIAGRRVLALRFREGVGPSGSLPILRGVEVEVVTQADGSGTFLLRLLESSHCDIFLQLCRDIIVSTAAAKDEASAIQMALTRTWRWHHLLRAGADAKLTREEQKGLVGELLLLVRTLLPVIPAGEAVAGWLGPTGAPKDFELGSVCVEAKARRSAATPYVAISSEHQLDTSAVGTLFLAVVHLESATPQTEDAFSVTSLSRRTVGAIGREDLGALPTFETMLAATGFRWEDDYSDSLWIERASDLYRVEEEFPRLTAASVPVGLRNVKYSLDLSGCEPYKVGTEALLLELTRRHHDV